MSFRRRQLLGWTALLVFVIAGGLWLARLDFREKISSDVLDLIPADEQSPELVLVRTLASQAEARTMLFVLTDGAKAPAAPAVERFVSSLSGDPAFSEVLVMGDPAIRDAMGARLFELRYSLLFPLWLEEMRQAWAAGGGEEDFSNWLAARVATRLDAFLSTPEALAFQEMIPADPLLLMPWALEQLQAGLGLIQPSGAAPDSAALIWAQISESPLSEGGQQPVFDAIARAMALVRADHPSVDVRYTGVNRFASASRDRIVREVAWLNTLSVLAVLAVALVFIRRIHRGFHLLPVLVLSTLGAWVGTTLIFDQLHVLVLVVGSLLTGVAIDYGFYLFMQPPAHPGEDYWAKVQRLAKPLLVSCFTTVAGFALLLFSELPFIRQLGVYVSIGLMCALGVAVLYFATVRVPYLETRQLPERMKPSDAFCRRVRRGLLVGWIALLPGLVLLNWRDDIRQLEISSPELLAEDAAIRARFGGSDEGTTFLTFGTDIAGARSAWDAFQQWLEESSGGQARAVGLGTVIPTEGMLAAASDFRSAHPGFAENVRSTLAEAGFEAGEFSGFVDEFEELPPLHDSVELEESVASLQETLVGPMGFLIHTEGPLSWLVSLTENAPAEMPPAETQTVTASQLQSLNRLFARYRASALWLSITALAVIGAGVYLAYGLRDGMRTFAIPAGACLGVFGLFGWVGVDVNLFHLLGAFLGVCLTHNYSIFSATSVFRREAPPVSVRMSALTTAASFGALALSKIPVVSALGSTVALMVVGALALIEFGHLTALGDRT